MRRTLHDYSPEQASWATLAGTESAIAGGGAGLVGATVTCPLDVIKTKLQASSSHQYRGLVHTFKQILVEEGVQGLYRGLGPTILGYLPTWAIYFTVYDGVKAKMCASRPAGEEDLSIHMVSAMAAGATSTTVTNPLWVIKTRFMTQGLSGHEEARYRHTADAIKRIWKTEGAAGFYKGLVPSLFGVSHVAVQFPLYERLKLLNQPADGSEVSPSVILACSASSKMVASMVTYPHEVLRTRLQIQRKNPDSKVLGIWETLLNIWHRQGIRGFYRGLSVNLLRTVPNSAMTILTYELLIRVCVLWCAHAVFYGPSDRRLWSDLVTPDTLLPLLRKHRASVSNMFLALSAEDPATDDTLLALLKPPFRLSLETDAKPRHQHLIERFSFSH